jgi:hypothetical protein
MKHNVSKKTFAAEPVAVLAKNHLVEIQAKLFLNSKRGRDEALGKRGFSLKINGLKNQLGGR